MLLVLIQANGRFSSDSWHHAEMDSVEYFNLADLWEQYYEWSAYGAGTTVQLYGGERVVQYYVPYLSGIQLYTNKAQTASRSGQKIRSCAWILSLCRFLDALWIGSLSVFFFCRSFGEDNGMDYWSDDEDNEKMSRSWSSTSEDSLFNCDAISGNRKRHGHMYFEFFEVCSPYGRIPLIDKVNFYVLCDSSLDQLFLFPMLISFFYRCMNYPRAILGWHPWEVLTFRLLVGCQLPGIDQAYLY